MFTENDQFTNAKRRIEVSTERGNTKFSQTNLREKKKKKKKEINWTPTNQEEKLIPAYIIIYILVSTKNCFHVFLS